MTPGIVMAVARAILRTALSLAMFALPCVGVFSSVAVAQTAAEGMSDVFLVLDNSGSMKSSDPRRLMPQAVRELTDRLEAGSRVGVVVFDENVRLVFPPTDANRPGFKDGILDSFESIDYRGQRTDIPGGVERALYELRERGRNGSDKTIILFTDGIVDMPDPSKNRERRQWLREALAADAKQSGIRIFGVAFTDQADFELIQTLSQTTGGMYYRVSSADDISPVFDRIRGQLRRPAASGSRPAAPESPAMVEPADWSWLWLWVVSGSILAGAAGLVSWRFVVRPLAVLEDVDGTTKQKTYQLGRRPIHIGREKRFVDASGRINTNHVVIPNSSVSAQHAEIGLAQGQFHLRDHDSTRGTFVDGERVRGQVILRHGSVIRFSSCRFQFLLAASKAPALKGGTNVDGLAEEGAEGTEVKPEWCTNDDGRPPAGVCEACGRAFCAQCLVQQGERQVCRAHASVRSGHASGALH